MDGNKLKITISGPTASGKTTIALLIERVLRFNGLNVEVNDVDLGEVHSDRLEKHQDVSFQKRCLNTLVEKKTAVEVVTVATNASE